MQEDQLEISEQFNLLAKRIFTEDKGKICIGGEEIKPEVLDLLREQARYLETSQLYEIFRATIINESAELALKQSQNFEQVQFAKALYHLLYVFDNMILKLKNK